jgi:GNAT superfamily N-acetyltransferase
MNIELLTPKYIPYVANVIKERWEISDEDTMREIKRWMSDRDDSACFVGVVDGAPVAFGLFDIQSDVDSAIHSWNRQLWVEPTHRGKDYGYKLTEARFLWAKEKGYKSVYLSTEAKKEYHLKHGWQVIREDVKNDKTITIMKYDL